MLRPTVCSGRRHFSPGKAQQMNTAMAGACAGETAYRPHAGSVVAANKRFSGQDSAIDEEHDQALDRSQRRLLRRIYNGRTVPVVADGRSFLTYKEAARYLLSLTPDAREKAYAEMRSCAGNGPATQP